MVLRREKEAGARDIPLQSRASIVHRPIHHDMATILSESHRPKDRHRQAIILQVKIRRREGVHDHRTLDGRGQRCWDRFQFWGKTGNTRDSHRLVELGETKGADVQTRVVEELFRSYFEEEGDITSGEVLRQAGVRAGLEEVEVKNWLESDRGGDEVDKKVTKAQIRGVSGVPNFVFQGKYEISGAQDAEAFVKVFEKVKEMEGL